MVTGPSWWSKRNNKEINRDEKSGDTGSVVKGLIKPRQIPDFIMSRFQRALSRSMILTDLYFLWIIQATPGYREAREATKAFKREFQ